MPDQISSDSPPASVTEQSADPRAALNSDAALLDNPIWSSLATEHRALALGDDRARRFPADIGPLSGMPRQSFENYNALRSLARPGGVAVLFLREPPSPPPFFTLIRGGLIDQMISPAPVMIDSPGLPPDAQLRPLTNADVPAMLELTQLTEPGPFRERTHELGAFFGIFHSGRLVAMAGQRLHHPRHVEVSAVCTHPDARGRGYARILISTVADEIRGRGKTPILHTFADNHSAIRVYQGLGFTRSRTFHLAVLKNDA
jgi:GNAT superfamily N-acetyltransferase